MHRSSDWRPERVSKACRSSASPPCVWHNGPFQGSRSELAGGQSVSGACLLLAQPRKDSDVGAQEERTSLGPGQ